MRRSLYSARSIQGVYEKARELPFLEGRHHLLELQRVLTKGSPRRCERTEVRRRINEHILLLAYCSNESPSVIRAVVKKLRAIGFRSLERRLFVVSLFAQATGGSTHLENVPFARSL